MKIAIGSDHAGVEYKTYLLSKLNDLGVECTDMGTYSTDSVDYPDYAHHVASAVADDEVHFGVLICGSANGVAMAANKHQKVRAAISWSREIAELARQHNDANILCLPARFVSKELAWEMLDAFLKTPFEGGRHQRRVEKIACS